MSSHSDSLYKQLFSHPEIVRDLVAGFLAADWAQALDVADFERVNASYASEQGPLRHDDVVWRARIGGEWVYVYILLEFQSRPDKWMALRMLVYIGLLYQDLVAQHKLSKHGKLLPVLPIVLYHGRRPWRAAIELAELTLSPPEGLARFQAQQQYLLIDRHHDERRSDIVALLFRLLGARTEAEMRAAVNAVAARVRQPDLASARESLVRWIRLTLQEASGVTSIDLEEGYAMEFERKFTIKEMFDPDMFERPRREAREAGLVEGRAEGRQEGRQQGQQQGELLALQSVLRNVLPGADMTADIAEQIAAADAAQLNAWIRALFAGASPRQVFAEG
jgi:predicted transposase/invertase (TIGR01784 family)